MKKIMFNDKYGLTQTVLDGRKTFTRRIIDYSRNKVFLDLLGDEYYMKHEGALSYDYDDDVLRIDDDFDCYILKPKYKIGATCLKDNKGKIYLDELNPNRGDPVQEIIPDCSLICQIEFQEILDRQVKRVLDGEIGINDVK